MRRKKQKAGPGTDPETYIKSLCYAVQREQKDEAVIKYTQIILK